MFTVDCNEEGLTEFRIIRLLYSAVAILVSYLKSEEPVFGELMISLAFYIRLLRTCTKLKLNLQILLAELF